MMHDHAIGSVYACWCGGPPGMRAGDLLTVVAICDDRDVPGATTYTCMVSTGALVMCSGLVLHGHCNIMRWWQE